jgi:hypothetical protein
MHFTYNDQADETKDSKMDNTGSEHKFLVRTSEGRAL